MIAPDIAQLSNAGIRSLLEAWLLMLAGYAGTPGITSPQAVAATFAKHATVHTALQRLTKKGLLVHSSKDGTQGRANRYYIAPAGLSLLQTQPVEVINPITQNPLQIAL